MTTENGEFGSKCIGKATASHTQNSCTTRSIMPPLSLLLTTHAPHVARACREKVDPDNIFPYEVPISFGEESQPLEVSRDLTTS